MVQPDDFETWDPGGPTSSPTPNSYLQARIAAHIATTKSEDQMSVSSEERVESRTDFDTHANMPVCGRHSLVVGDTGKTVDVSPFTPDYKSMCVPLVDAVVQYDCPYTLQSQLLLIRNALHVPAMSHNLIPPFMLREAGIQVSDTPKIQVADPDVDDHAIVFQETGFRIPLALWGTFSYFPTSKPSLQACVDLEDVYVLTPNRWDPHSDAYARSEESMLDWEGNIVAREHRVRIVFDDIEEPPAYMASSISAAEAVAIDQIFTPDSDDVEEVRPAISDAPIDSSEVSSMLLKISPTLEPCSLYHSLSIRADTLRQCSALGATTVSSKTPYLIEPDSESEVESADDSTFEDAAWVNDVLATACELEDAIADDVFASAAHARPRRDVTPEMLSKLWRIDLDTAKRTLDATTINRSYKQNDTLPRNFGTGDRMLRYRRISEHFFMDTFFATKKAGKSSRGHTCCQLFVTDKGFVYVVPMRSRSDILAAVKQFAKEIGAPDAIISDAAPEQKSRELRKFCNDIGTTLRALEEGTPWSNRAELYIGIIKEAVRRDMKESNCPLAFWDYCVERRARINNLTAKDLFQLHGTTAHTATLHEDGDISSLCQFGWYEWCYFREQGAGFPFPKEVLGRVLGPTKTDGNEMAQWVLKSNGKVLPRRSLRPLNPDEIHSDVEAAKRKLFDELIERRWGTSINPPNPISSDVSKDTDDNEWEEAYDNDEDARVIPDVEDTVDSTGRLINQQPLYDRLINAEVQLQLGDQMSHGVVRRRSIGPDGRSHGEYDDNPFLNSIIYEVEFPDGQVREYAANVIAENILTQVDSEGYSLTMMEGIVDYKKDPDTAVSMADRFVVTRRGQKRLRKTTVGWKLLVQWKDGSESWVPLKDMKESHPVEVAEFAKARGIDQEPAFCWWVPYTLRKRDAIIAAVKSRVRKTTHKYGVEIPNSVEHARRLDQANGNTLWMDALSKEMTNIGVAFEILQDGAPPPGWKPVSGHIIWDVKMDFTRKARWVLDGHKTPSVTGSTFAGVVSRDSVRIALTYAALNELQVCAADIRSAYLQAPSSQKDYVICGPEFGLENVGKPALIHRAVYGGKSAGRDFRNHLRACMHHLDFKSCPADPDVWLRPAKKDDGSACYEYILLYTDDVLAIGSNAERLIRDGIGRYFELKEESIGPPDIYLGGKMREVTLENGVKAWAFGSSQYVHAAVKNVEAHLERSNEKLPNKTDTPIQTSY